MKAILALVTMVFTLSLCNLMGKRGSNTNDSPAPAPTGEITSATPSSTADARTSNSNRDATDSKELKGVPRTAPDAPLSRSGANHNSATMPPPPTPKPTMRAPISGGVLNGKATSLPKPAYPAIAKAAHASGTVTVQVTIDESGNVISARAVSGHPLLKSSAEAAARQAKFAPTKLSGQPVKVTGVIVYNFVAQ